MRNLQEAQKFIQLNIGQAPEVALILGSGLGHVADSLTDTVTIPYKDIPGFPVSTAPGHASKLVVGTLQGTRVLVFQGRFHYYEGYNMEQIAFPIRCLTLLGCKTLILTNAAGGVNTNYQPGDLMLISDHINTTGQNPLVGANYDNLGPRFPDLSYTYTPKLRTLAKKIANSLHINLQEGVYAWTTGPSFETPAEIRMLRNSGADAVGMSTVPEAILATHGGIQVLGISCISNMAAGVLDQPITEEEVMEIGKSVSGKFSALITELVKNI